MDASFRAEPGHAETGRADGSGWAEQGRGKNEQVKNFLFCKAAWLLKWLHYYSAMKEVH